MSTKGDKKITNIKSQGNSFISTCFSSKNGVTVAIPYDLYSHIWMTGGGVASKRDGKNGKKKSWRRRRERGTHTHTCSHSCNDNYNDNIITTIIIFIPYSSSLSISLPLPSFLLSFTFNFLRTRTHSHTRAKKFHHSFLSLFFFPSFHSSGAQL